MGPKSESQTIIMLEHSKHSFSDDEDTFLKRNVHIIEIARKGAFKPPSSKMIQHDHL